MIGKAIYNAIKNDTTIAPKLLLSGTVYNIYPIVVPENTQFTKAVTYELITENPIYPLVRIALVDIKCIAYNYDDAIDLANDIDRIFKDKTEYKLGNQLSVTRTDFKGKSEYYDPETKTWIIVVEISIKF